MKDRNEEILALHCGERIRLLRESMGMNQEEFGEFLDCSDESISKVERGLHMMKVWRMIRLCQACGVSLDYLIRGINTEDSDAVPAFVIELFQNADSYERRILQDHIQNAQNEISRKHDMEAHYKTLYGDPNETPDSSDKGNE